MIHRNDRRAGLVGTDSGHSLANSRKKRVQQSSSGASWVPTSTVGPPAASRLFASVTSSTHTQPIDLRNVTGSRNGARPLAYSAITARDPTPQVACWPDQAPSVQRAPVESVKHRARGARRRACAMRCAREQGEQPVPAAISPVRRRRGRACRSPLGGADLFDADRRAHAFWALAPSPSGGGRVSFARRPLSSSSRTIAQILRPHSSPPRRGSCGNDKTSSRRLARRPRVGEAAFRKDPAFPSFRCIIARSIATGTSTKRSVRMYFSRLEKPAVSQWARALHSRGPGGLETGLQYKRAPVLHRDSLDHIGHSQARGQRPGAVQLPG